MFLGLIILVSFVISSVTADSVQTAQNRSLTSFTPFNITILAINDFHGQISPGKSVNGIPVGGTGVLAAYLLDAINQSGENRTIIALPGDITGASVPESGMLLDEPALLFFNMFAGNTSTVPRYSPVSSVPIVATVGNHEFDKGTGELIRKIKGGNWNTTISHLQNPYPGANMNVVASNIFIKENNETFLPPYAIIEIGGVKVAFIGAVTKTTPDITMHEYVKDLIFTDETDAINRQVSILKSQGIHAFVIILHEGGVQSAYDGPTRTSGQVTGRVLDIVSGLDSDVDVVLSGHTHEFTNTFLNNSANNSVLVTQAYSYNKAFAKVNISIDPVTGDIIGKSASIIYPYADRYPGYNPVPQAVQLLNDSLNLSDPYTQKVITTTFMNITTAKNPDGESALYDLVTDSMRVQMKSDIGFINEGGIRSNLTPVNVTYGNLYATLPFGDNVLVVNMTGSQVKNLLEQQWNRTTAQDHMVMISGFSYTYNTTRPVNYRVINMSINGSPIDPEKVYTVGTNTYFAQGGDGYTVMQGAKTVLAGPLDVDVLQAYIQSLPSPLYYSTDGRVRIDSAQNLTITGIQPDSGTRNSTLPVTIKGQGFNPQENVTFNSANWTIKTINTSISSTTTIQCSLLISESTVPGRYNLTVQNPDGTSFVLQNAFTVLSNPKPVITEVQRTLLHRGEKRFAVVKGFNFMPGAVVKLEKNSSQIVWANCTTISGRMISGYFVVPENATLGAWNLIITNPDGQVGIKENAFLVAGPLNSNSNSVNESAGLAVIYSYFIEIEYSRFHIFSV